MLLLELIVLQEFLVLKRSVFGLDRVETVAQGHVVFVSLLNLEDLRLQLGDEQILALSTHWLIKLESCANLPSPLN
jgi:hypothetical protein